MGAELIFELCISDLAQQCHTHNCTHVKIAGNTLPECL